MIKQLKVCFAASSGGHLEEMSRLSSLVQEGDFVWTERSEMAALDWCKNIVYVPQMNRREWLFILKFIWLFLKSFYWMIKEKPDAIVSTGALITYPICLIGKMFGKRVIYIESFARVDQSSLTGKLLYKIADIFIVQWKEMLKVYPHAIYGGGIF